jgi:hypothetical protein
MPCAVRPHYSWRLVPLTDGIHSGWYRIRWSRSPDPGPTHLFAVSPRRMAHSVAQTKWPCQSSADTSSGSLASAKCSALAAIQWSDSLAVQPVASGRQLQQAPFKVGPVHRTALQCRLPSTCDQGILSATYCPPHTRRGSLHGHSAETSTRLLLAPFLAHAHFLSGTTRLERTP